MALNNAGVPDDQSEILVGIRDRLDTLIQLLTANTENRRFKVTGLGDTPAIDPSMLTADLSTSNTIFLGVL